ncbi:MAG: hypothetical protein Q8P21_00250, partial [bacterium]|nr:hypothetical protein [bacterium]
MKFFDFVVKYWFIWIYYIVFATTVFRFQRQVVMKAYWYRKVHYHLLDRWGAQWLHRDVGSFVLFLLVLLPIALLLFQIAPILWIVLGHLDAKEQKRRDEQDKEYRERERAERERIQQENARRCEARKQWLAENKPKLRYNTVSGVTAVLR